MSDETVSLGVRVEGSETAASDLTKVKDAAGSIKEGADEARGAAVDLSEEFERIKSIKSFEVQKEELDKLRRSLVEGEKQFDAMGKGGERGANTMRAAIKKVDDEAEALNAEIKKLGTEAPAQASRIDAAFRRTEDAFADFDKAVEAGSPRMRTHLDRLVILQSNYRDEIIRTFGSLEQATPEAVANYQKLETRIEAGKIKVRETSDALKDHRGELAKGGETWSGFGNAIEKAAGPMGATVAKAGLVTAAFKEGWDIGMKINEFIGTDMSLWTEVIESFATRAALIVRGLSDTIVAQFNVVASIWTAIKNKDLEEFKRALSDAADVGEKSGEMFRTAFAGSTAEANKLALELNVGKKAIEENAEAQKLAAERAKERTEREKELREELEKRLAKEKEITDELAKAAALRAQTTERLTEETGALGRYSEILELARDRVDRLEAEEEELRAEWGEDSFAVEAHRETLANAREELERLADEVAQRREDVIGLQEEEQRLTETIAQQNEKMAELESATKKQTVAQSEARNEVVTYRDASGQLQIETREATTTTTEAADATKNLGSAQAAAKQEIITYRDEAGRLHVETREIAAETKKAADATTSLADSQTKAADPAARLTESLAGLKTSLSALSEIDLSPLLGKLDDVISKVDELKSKSDEATISMTNLSNAGVDEEVGGDQLTVPS